MRFALVVFGCFSHLQENLAMELQQQLDLEAHSLPLLDLMLFQVRT